MIQVIDYGPFNWRDFFKMLTQSLGVNLNILPNPIIYLSWGSMSLRFRLGHSFPNTYRYIDRYGVMFHYKFFEFHLDWWIHNPNPHGR
jgi:hypothetical protein